MSKYKPEGDLVTKPPALHPDPSKTLIGQHGIRLVPTTKDHFHGLFASVCGPENDDLWTYMPSGPHRTVEAFSATLTARMEDDEWLLYTIFPTSSFIPSQVSSSQIIAAVKAPTSAIAPMPLGIICLINFSPANLSIEIGHVLYAKSLQRTPASTEATYMLLRYAFEELGYARVVWKANSWNVPSRRAAVRLGFVEEGTFRKHLVVKGVRRDSVWFSCIDDEWFLQGRGSVKAGLEGWLEKSNFDEKGIQIRKLEDIRNSLTEGGQA
ncbi:related to GNAT family acetyltransferase [Rhynchosporium secalis]|uniref:Related to GNAT family acetyltransferase n=1 Tax=Rhynchosporium secalis TaxID=38038 RepID=A0A1E1MH69_RHYSE|nr:related to GNAT family acetyltransferase [Rhynchosporium secalis]